MASIYKRLSSNNYANQAVPVGGATASNQVIEINLLTSIDSEIAASNVTLLSIDGHVDGVETLLTSIDNKLTSPLAVTGPLTDDQLRATPVPVSGSFSITGVSTSALQTSGNASLTNIDGKLNSLGQKTAANSMPVVTASDQIQKSASASMVNGGANLDLDVTGMSTAALDISGTWTGNIAFYGSVDGVIFFTMSGVNTLLLDGQIPSLALDNGQFQFNVAGLKTIRMLNAVSTGTAIVRMASAINNGTINAILAPIFIGGANPLPVAPSSSSGSAPSTASVTNVSSTVVASNASRKGLVITNLTSTRVFLAFGAVAVVNSGIMLVNGGTFVMDSFIFTTQDVRAITSSGSSTLAIQEYV